MQISMPIWLGKDIFKFCLSFVLYFHLLVKKGLVHDERTKSITFLQAIQEPAYVVVITTLQAHINTYQLDDFGYLPPNLFKMGLAAQMNKNAKARVQDIISCVNRIEWHNDVDHMSMPDIQGYLSPKVYRTDITRPRSCMDRWGQDAGTSLPCNSNNHNGGWDPVHSRRDSNECSCAGPHDWYARPDYNHRARNPDIICVACKRRGHPASNCNMLAMHYVWKNI
jgi:hypothetical protein